MPWFKSPCSKAAPPIRSGRSPQRITDAMVEEAGARREAIVVTFVEVSKESYASGGVLMADKSKYECRDGLRAVPDESTAPATALVYPSGSNRCPSMRSATLGRSFLANCRKCGEARCASSAASSLYCS